MNSQELGTAVQLDLNLVVLEDRAYGMIRWKQEVDKADLPDSARMSAVEGESGRRRSITSNLRIRRVAAKLKCQH